MLKSVMHVENYVEEKIVPVCMQPLYDVHAMENLAVLKKHVENFSMC